MVEAAPIHADAHGLVLRTGNFDHLNKLLVAFFAVTDVSLSVLVALVNSSLLRPMRDATGQAFYSMHELLRQFAAHKLTTIKTLMLKDLT